MFLPPILILEEKNVRFLWQLTFDLFLKIDLIKTNKNHLVPFLKQVTIS